MVSTWKPNEFRGSLIAPFWGRKEITWTQSSDVRSPPRRYSSLILYLLVDAEESLWLSPKAGSGRDWMPLTAKVSRSVFIGGAQKQAQTSQTPSTCLSEVMWGRASSHLCRTHPMLLLPHPALCCSHQAETLPCRVCALLPVHQHDRKDSCHCPWLQFKHIQCHCKFYGTIFIGGFGHKAVVVQLINTNCWF